MEKDEQERLRRRNATNPDPRARRTRERLVAAFQSAADAPGIDALALTPSELASRAGVNRTTFYAHFTDPGELAVEALSEVFELVASSDAAGRRAHHARETSRASLHDVAAFVSDRREIYASLLQSGQGAFRSALEERFTERNRRTIAALAGRPRRVDDEVTARWVAAAVMGVLTWWLADGQLADGSRLSVDDLASTLTELLPPWFITDVEDAERDLSRLQNRE